MKGQLLIVLMSILGIALTVNSVTSIINPKLFKSAMWLFRGIFK